MLLFKTALLAALLLLVLSTEKSECQTNSLQEDLVKCVLDNSDVADSLISANRLLIKPIVDRLISESIRFEFSGKSTEAENLRFVAEKIAQRFRHMHGEKSLETGVSYLQKWTEDQKRKKLQADSIYAAGTKQRLGNAPYEALRSYELALEIYGQLGDERGEAEVLGGIGVIYYNRQDSALSLKYYMEALRKREKVDDKVLTGNTLNSLGSVYYNFHKDYSKAIDYYTRAETIRREIGDGTALRTTRQFLVAAYISSGGKLKDVSRNFDALGQFEKALMIAIDVGLTAQKGEALNQIGFIHFLLGDNVTASGKLTEAAAIMREMNDSSGLAGVYNHFGIVLQNAGRSEKAMQYYFDALGIYRKQNNAANQLPVLNNLGTFFNEQKQYERALEFLSAGLDISRDLKETQIELDFLINMANTQLLSGQREESFANYTKALDLASKLNNPDRLLRIFLGMAEYYEASGDYSKTLELNDTALKMIEGLRKSIGNADSKATYIARERFIFEDIIDLLSTLYVKTGLRSYEERAFSYCEASKSRVLLDLLSDTIIGAESCTIDEISYLLGNDDVLIEYSVGDSSTGMWVISRKGYELFRLPGRKALIEKNELLRFALIDPSPDNKSFLINTASELYTILIKPAEQFITDHSKLIIIPDDILSYLPFEVLLTGECDETSGYATLPYLVKKYPVSYAQSAGVLKRLSGRSIADGRHVNKHSSMLAFGDPVFADTNSYHRLQYSGKEIAEIGKYFSKKNYFTFLGNEATEEAAKSKIRPGITYLHFATHGYVDEQKPDLSSLILSKSISSLEDGLLQSSEITKLKLDADLVVLSACQTGLGKLIRGEGMIGLTRAFMYAGAPSVLVSLWNVSDYSTSRLMGEFYRNLIRNRLDKSISLRNAQITLMSDEKYAHPFYWAPFILLGDWR